MYTSIARRSQIVCDSVHFHAVHSTAQSDTNEFLLLKQRKMATIKFSHFISHQEKRTPNQYKRNCLLRWFCELSLKREFDPLCNLLNPRQLCITLQTVCINRKPLVRFGFCFLVVFSLHLSHSTTLSLSLSFTHSVSLYVFVCDCPCAQMNVK